MAAASDATSPETLRAQQFTLARHIRDPQANPPPPGIEERRLAIYRELFYNNLQSLLSGNFPVIRRVLGDDGWHARVRAFLRDHRSRTPLFPEIAREFIRFLEDRRAAGADDPPFLLELAHYEWVEMALLIEESTPADVLHDPAGDLLAGAPALSPLAWPLAYAFPVHRIGPDFMPTEAPPTPTLLLVRRTPGFEVKFSEVSALTFRLLQRLGESPDLSGRAQLEALAAEAVATDVEAFMREGARMLTDLRASGVVLGTRTNQRSET